MFRRAPQAHRTQPAISTTTQRASQHAANWYTQLEVSSGPSYSAQMIALCCKLSLLIGFRAVPKVIACFAETFALDIKVPSRDVVRNWSCRNGVAILGEACHSDDWIWMIDHSVQLGKMYVLVVLGIRQSQLPEGRALCRQDMTPSAVLPTTSRDKTGVGQQLATVAKDLGTPLAVRSRVYWHSLRRSLIIAQQRRYARDSLASRTRI